MFNVNLLFTHIYHKDNSVLMSFFIMRNCVFITRTFFFFLFIIISRDFPLALDVQIELFGVHTVTHKHYNYIMCTSVFRQFAAIVQSNTV